MKNWKDIVCEFDKISNVKIKNKYSLIVTGVKNNEHEFSEMVVEYNNEKVVKRVKNLIESAI